MRLDGEARFNIAVTVTALTIMGVSLIAAPRGKREPTIETYSGKGYTVTTLKPELVQIQGETREGLLLGESEVSEHCQPEILVSLTDRISRATTPGVSCAYRLSIAR